MEQREQLHAGGLPRQERVEAGERGLGLGLAAERGEDRGQQLAEQHPRPLRAQRPHVPRASRAPPRRHASGSANPSARIACTVAGGGRPSR